MVQVQLMINPTKATADGPKRNTKNSWRVLNSLDKIGNKQRSTSELDLALRLDLMLKSSSTDYRNSTDKRNRMEENNQIRIQSVATFQIQNRKKKISFQRTANSFKISRQLRQQPVKILKFKYLQIIKDVSVYFFFSLCVLSLIRNFKINQFSD